MRPITLPNWTNEELQALLERWHTCPESKQWIYDTGFDAREAWARCPHPYWLLIALLNIEGDPTIPTPPGFRAMIDRVDEHHDAQIEVINQWYWSDDPRTQREMTNQLIAQADAKLAEDLRALVVWVEVRHAR